MTRRSKGSGSAAPPIDPALLQRGHGQLNLSPSPPLSPREEPYFPAAREPAWTRTRFIAFSRHSAAVPLREDVHDAAMGFTLFADRVVRGDHDAEA